MKQELEAESSSTALGHSPLGPSTEMGAVRLEMPAERIAMGKATRSQVPRTDHAAWHPPANRPDPIDLLEAQAATRLRSSVPIRYGRMLASPFAFYRGAAVIMASDLATMPNTGLHVSRAATRTLANFGGFASPERELILDISDFDETLPGPWEWDLKRLAASFESAVKGDCKTNTRRRLVLATVEANTAIAPCANSPDEVISTCGTCTKPRGDSGALGNVGKAQGHEDVQCRLCSSFPPDNCAPMKLTTRVNGQLRIGCNPPFASCRLKTSC